MSTPVPDPAAADAPADELGEAGDAAEPPAAAADAYAEASEHLSRVGTDQDAEGADAVATAAEATGKNPADPDHLAERAVLAGQLEAVTAERDDFLDQLQRQRAEFRNFRRRIESERQQQIAAGVSRLVESLLPVLDGCDAAAAQGHTEVAAVGQALMVALEKAGLERIDAVGQAFDPTQHEAVTIEPAPEAEDRASDATAGGSAVEGEASADDIGTSDIGNPQQTVTAELRSGFRFEGRVLRAAMVKVRTA